MADIDGTEYSIIKLYPGEKKMLNFSFFTNKRFAYDTLKITAKCEGYNKYVTLIGLS